MTPAINPWRSTSENPAVFYPQQFGGAPSLTSENDAINSVALQQAFNAAVAARGMVDLGMGTNTWRFDTPLLGDTALRIVGSTSGGRGGSGVESKPKLRYVGEGALPAIKFVTSTKVELSHVHFDYINPLFTGRLVDFTGSTDTINCHIHHCAFNGGAPSYTAEHMLRINRANSCTVEQNSFSGSSSSLLCYDGLHNSCVTRENTFKEMADGSRDHGQVRYLGNIQSGICSLNTFEAGGASSRYQSVRFLGADNYNMTMSGNWHGDGGPDKWISGWNGIAGNGVLTVEGSFFGGNQGKVVSMGNDGGHLVFRQNRVMNQDPPGATVGVDTAPNPYSLTMHDNSLGGPAWAVGEGPSLGRYYRMNPQGINYLPGATMITGQGGAGEWEAISALLEAESEFYPAGQMLVGGGFGETDPYLTITTPLWGTKNMPGVGSGDKHLLIQGPCGNADDKEGIVLVAGATPSDKLRVDGKGVAVNGKVPPTILAAPAAATDAATTQTLANALRTAMVNFGIFGP